MRAFPLKVYYNLTPNNMRTITQNIYSLSELSKEARQKAIKVEREDVNENGLYFLNEDLTEQCKEKLKLNDIEGEPRLYYSLNYCQGDGIMFEGSFYWKGFSITIKQSGHYYHSNSKEIDIIDSSKDDYTQANKEVYEEFKNIYQAICEELEKTGYAEIEYENENNTIIERFNDSNAEFFKDGIRYFESL